MTTMPVVIKVSSVGVWDVSTIAFGPAHFETVAFGPHGRQSKEFRESTLEDAVWRHRRTENQVILGVLKWTN